MNASVITTIANAVVSLLVLYFKKLGEGIVQKGGEEIGEHAAKAMWNRAIQVCKEVKGKFALNREMSEAFNTLKRTPEDTDAQERVQRYLKEVMTNDEGFAVRLSALLSEESKDGINSVFQTIVSGDVQKIVQINEVQGDVHV